MEVYTSEEERLEALERWWKENKSSVILGVALGSAVVIGWNMWQGNRQSMAEQASRVYQQMLKANEDHQPDSATKLAERLTASYPASTYAEFAQLYLAKARAETGDYAGARQILEHLVENTTDATTRQLARLRLGRAMLAAGDSAAGLKLVEPLSEKDTGTFATLFEELKGDLYLAARRPVEARRAYEIARELGEKSPLLELKLNELPPPTAPKAAP